MLRVSYVLALLLALPAHGDYSSDAISSGQNSVNSVIGSENSATTDGLNALASKGNQSAVSDPASESIKQYQTQISNLEKQQISMVDKLSMCNIEGSKEIQECTDALAKANAMTCESSVSEANAACETTKAAAVAAAETALAAAQGRLTACKESLEPKIAETQAAATALKQALTDTQITQAAASCESGTSCAGTGTTAQTSTGVAATTTTTATTNSTVKVAAIDSSAIFSSDTIISDESSCDNGGSCFKSMGEGMATYDSNGNSTDSEVTQVAVYPIYQSGTGSAGTRWELSDGGSRIYGNNGTVVEFDASGRETRRWVTP